MLLSFAVVSIFMHDLNSKSRMASSHCCRTFSPPMGCLPPLPPQSPPRRPPPSAPPLACAAAHLCLQPSLSSLGVSAFGLRSPPSYPSPCDRLCPCSPPPALSSSSAVATAIEIRALAVVDIFLPFFLILFIFYFSDKDELFTYSLN